MVRLELTTQIAAPIDRCFDLSRSIEVHQRGTGKTGEKAVGGVTTGLVGPGEYIRWRARHFGIRQHLSSRITAYDRPCYFQDTMFEGAFRSMQHDHTFRELPDGTTEMRDTFAFAAPIPILGQLAETLFLRRYMTSFLIERNRILKEVAESPDWREYLPNTNPMHVRR